MVMIMTMRLLSGRSRNGYIHRRAKRATVPGRCVALWIFSIVIVVTLISLLPIELARAQTQPAPAPLEAGTKLRDASISSTLNASPQPGNAPSGLLPEGDDPENRPLTPFLKHLVFDQKEFWTEPLRWRWPDAKLLLPFAGMTATLLAKDAAISKFAAGSRSEVNRSQTISAYGTYSFIGITGAAYLWGDYVHDDHLRETGFLAGEAALDSTAVAYLLKALTERPRPFQNNGNGTFFHGGASFPSEHSAIAWSVASVVAHEYPGRLTQIAAYGLASAVTLTRFTAKQHFSSDVVLGSALGWYFARQVFRAHHDSELGGSAWGNFYGGSDEDSDSGEKWRNPERMASPYVPLDSWVYPAIARLAGLGYIKTAFLCLKPWTRLETANLVSEAKSNLEAEENISAISVRLQGQLEREFAYEMGLLEGHPNATAKVESIYTRSVAIGGPALTDSYHFGQTIAYDYGRPFQRGTSGQAGSALWVAAGPLAIYVRGEFQHAPYAPPLSYAERNVIATVDLVPLPLAAPFATVNRPHLLEGYAALNVGGWQISAGKNSLDWGPSPGGSLLWSNNADPVEMVRVVKTDWRLPILGLARIDQFFGMFRGHGFIPHPYIYGQKINFKPLLGLELGFGRTVTIGGHGGDPLNTSTFISSFFGRVNNRLDSVPGDSHASMDWVFEVPKVRNYLVFYGDLYADDDPVPIVNPPKNPYRPGIYLTRFPGLPKLDFHMEAVSTESPGQPDNQGNLNYWNHIYRDGYTNSGNLVGNTVGRMGRAIQLWSTYWISAQSTLQFSYRHSTVSPDFIPQGGAWQDYSVRHELRLASGLYVKSELQYEHISRYALLFSGPQNNLAAIVELGLLPNKTR
jgi:membrane-associated phospholipid phosphatase